MSLARFHLPPDRWSNDAACLEGEEAKHCAQVMRRGVGDEIIIFDELSDEDLSKIIDLQVANLNTVVAGRNLTVRLSEDARKWLIDRTLQERSYGARPLKRALQKYVEDELSEALIQGEISEGSEVEIVAGGGKLALVTVKQGDRDIELAQRA